MTRAEALKVAKPILFNIDMVRAIQGGTKTVTRRKALPYKDLHEFRCNKYPNGWWFRGAVYKDWDSVVHAMKAYECPCKYKVGDVLYVRETWFYEEHMHDKTAGKPDLPSGRYSFRYIYKASEPDYPVDVRVSANGWRPSIHMPKEAARIFLRVRSVYAERLQDINGYGVLAEGVDNGRSNPIMGERWENMQRMAYSNVWNSTLKKSDLKKYDWEANPWVWVIEFNELEVE